MKWAEKNAKVSSTSDFIFDNSEIELNVEYSPEIISNFDGEEEIEVCISGDEIGIWKGSLEYRTESSGNIGMGVGTWLKVNITEGNEEEEEEQIPPATSSSSSSSSSGSSGGGGGSVNTISTIQNNDSNETSENETQETPLGNLEEEVEKQGLGITGNAVVDFAKTSKGKSAGILIVLLVAFTGIIVYRKKFRKE